jgi:hypothetical protein
MKNSFYLFIKMYNNYPLRFSRNYWKIPLVCSHRCTNLCSSIIKCDQYDDNISISLESNKNYKNGRCENYNKLIPTFIHLKSFDISYPLGHFGKLYNPDSVVIPDLSFSIIIKFPLTIWAKIDINSDTHTTLRDLLWLLKNFYECIYETEEKTASPTLFTINKPCIQCTNIKLEESLTYIDYSEEYSGICSICYSPFSDKITKLNCEHIYHKDCIANWIIKGNGKNCPMCRKLLYSCNKCNNTKICSIQEEYVVLPYNLRQLTVRNNNQYNLNRNATNGIYQINGVDFEKLIISDIYYSRIKKELQIYVKDI